MKETTFDFIVMLALWFVFICDSAIQRLIPMFVFGVLATLGSWVWQESRMRAREE